MENLMFCLNATGPIFLMMVFGLFLRKVGILDEDFANRMNKFVFKIPLPFLLFGDLAAVDFSKAYFDLPCENCKTGLEEKKKFFDFLGFNFYIYAKDRKYVVSTLDREYEGMSFNRLQKSGKVNESYIVIINVCKHCGSYSIEIEEFEV